MLESISLIEPLMPSVENELQQKMKEYISCGVRLGWLINPTDKQVEIYRQKEEREILARPQTVSGEDVLPGLTVDLSDIL